MTDHGRPNVPWTTRLGAAAESEIKARLDRFCVASKYDVDPGLDFYCELLGENESPTMPFYVQAKGTDHFNGSWSAQVRKQTVSYWLEQPHPVFLIVYDNEANRCLWLSVESQRYDLYDRMRTFAGDSIRLRVHEWPELSREQDSIDSFVSLLKDADLSLRAFLGNPNFRGEGYVKQVPMRPRANVEMKRMANTVRACLYSLIQHYAATGDDAKAILCCDFLAKFDLSHFTHYVWRGNLAQASGDYRKAKDSYMAALDICLRDEKWPREEMNQIIAEIKSMIDQMNGKSKKNNAE